MEYKVPHFRYIHVACQKCGYDIPDSLFEYRNFEYREYVNLDIHILVNHIIVNYKEYYLIKSKSLYGCYIIQTLKKMLEHSNGI